MRDGASLREPFAVAVFAPPRSLPRKDVFDWDCLSRVTRRLRMAHGTPAARFRQAGRRVSSAMAIFCFNSVRSKLFTT